MKRMTRPTKTRLGRIVALIAATYLLNYLLAPVLVGEKLEIYFRPKYERPFDSKIWKQTSFGSTTNSGLRYEMFDDLISKKFAPQTDESELIALLGDADSVSLIDGDRCLFYVLGDQRQYPVKSFLFPWRFSNFDRWMLEVRFGRGKLVSWKIFFT